MLQFMPFIIPRFVAYIILVKMADGETEGQFNCFHDVRRIRGTYDCKEISVQIKKHSRDLSMQSSDIVAAFDFDGTVSRSDSLGDFIFYAVGGRKFAVGVICALPWFAGMLVGICDRADAKARFLAATIKGLALCELEDLQAVPKKCMIAALKCCRRC